jgi:threonine efflux protein
MFGKSGVESGIRAMPRGEVARRVGKAWDLSKSFRGGCRIPPETAELPGIRWFRKSVRVSGVMELMAFAGLMVLGQFSPGPDMLLLTRTALKEGRGNGVKMAAGIACGLSVHATLAVGGVAVLLQRLPTVRWAFQWLAAFYLLWLSYQLLRAVFVMWYSGGVVASAESNLRHPPFVRGVLCNIFNPKVALFLAAVCAPFLAGNHPAWWPWAIWGIIVGLGLSLWTLWVLLLQWPPLRARYESSALLLDGVFGVALGFLAVKLMIG